MLRPRLADRLAEANWKPSDRISEFRDGVSGQEFWCERYYVTVSPHIISGMARTPEQKFPLLFDAVKRSQLTAHVMPFSAL
jgi:hypothetical protein